MPRNPTDARVSSKSRYTPLPSGIAMKREAVWSEFRRLMIAGVAYTVMMLMLWGELKLSTHAFDTRMPPGFTVPTDPPWLLAPPGLALAFIYAVDRKAADLSDLLDNSVNLPARARRERVRAAIADLVAVRDATLIVVTVCLGISFLGVIASTAAERSLVPAYLALGVGVLLCWLAAGVLARIKELADKGTHDLKHHRAKLLECARQVWPVAGGLQAGLRVGITTTILGTVAGIIADDVSAAVAVSMITLLSVGCATLVLWLVATAHPGPAVLAAIGGMVILTGTGLAAILVASGWRSAVAIGAAPLIVLMISVGGSISCSMDEPGPRSRLLRLIDPGAVTTVGWVLNRRKQTVARSTDKPSNVSQWYRRLSGQEPYRGSGHRP